MRIDRANREAPCVSEDSKDAEHAAFRETLVVIGPGEGSHRSPQKRLQ
jgi:hypothetical protein